MTPCLFLNQEGKGPPYTQIQTEEEIRVEHHLKDKGVLTSIKGEKMNTVPLFIGKSITRIKMKMFQKRNITTITRKR